MFTKTEDSHDAARSDGQYDPPSDREGRPWVDVARVANLAEAGFIVDELTGMDLEARVHQVGEFSAATDRWSAQYHIRVPEEFAPAAADHIRQYLSMEPAGHRSMLQRMRESVDSARQEQTYSWRPALAVILVGVTSFLLGHQTSEQVAQRQPTSTDLAAAIASVGQPFYVESPANQPSFRLSFDRQSRSWTLAADRDHDGIYETTQRFAVNGAAR